MTDALTFIVAALAVYRISTLIALEDGPFDVMAKLRERVDQSSWVGRGVRCVVCVSFWIALIVTLVLSGSWLVWLGLAGAVAIIHRALTK